MSYDFVRNRARLTREAQASVTASAGWTWDHKSLAQWDADITTLDQLKTTETQTRTEWRNATALWQADVDRIKQITKDVADFGADKFRHAPEKFKLFQALRTDARGRLGIYDQGRKAQSAWQQADPLWTFSPDIDLGGFGSLIATSDARAGTYNVKLAAWRSAAALLLNKVRAVDKDNVAWYAAATRKFKRGTPEGDMIRSTVPTTYRPGPAVGPAVISHLMVSGTSAHFDVAAEHATRFTVLRKWPGSPVFLVVVAESRERSFTFDDLPVGVTQFKAYGSSSDGNGPESAIVEVTIAQQAAA